MKKSYIILLVIFPLLHSCSKKVETVKPIVGVLTESVYASGKVKADEQFNVYPLVSGILLRTLVEAGDTVSKGDTLFVLENVTSQLNSQNALALLDLSRENNGSGSDKLREMELAVDLAKEKYSLDSSLYNRQKRLWEQGIGAKSDFEQRELSMKNSKTAWESAESRLGQIKTQLKNDMKRAEINYDITRKTVNDFVIRSNVNGQVYAIYKDNNELVTPQTALGVVGTTDSFVLELQVDEYDMAKVAIGQRVLVTMDSYKGQVFDAHVTRIEPLMNERTRTFLVEAKFQNPPKLLFPNLSLEANIVIEERPNVLTIPRRFLADGKFVYLDEDTKVEVKTGLMDYEKVEIISGLDSSQAIQIPPAN